MLDVQSRSQRATMSTRPGGGSPVEEPGRIAEVWNDRTVNIGAGELPIYSRYSTDIKRAKMCSWNA